MKPVIIVNFKTYRKATGKAALKMAIMHDKVAMKTGVRIMIAVQNQDLSVISKSVSIPVMAEHADAVKYGAHTGKVLPENLKANGAWGVLVNHAEDRITDSELKKVVKRCSEAGLKTVICTGDMKKLSGIIRMKPYAIAYEEPELIGTGRAISKMKPESVRMFAQRVRKSGRSLPLCGAGISGAKDLKAAIDLGTTGVLVSSAITKAKDPEKRLMEFASALN